jgi:hypothetical protein
VKEVSSAQWSKGELELEYNDQRGGRKCFEHSGYSGDNVLGAKCPGYSVQTGDRVFQTQCPEPEVGTISIIGL